MAKKKITHVTVTPPKHIEIRHDDSVIETFTFEKEPASNDGSRYHATFTPTWRPEVDCGEHDSVEAAQQAIVDVAGEFEADVIPAWHRESPLVWLATGHDGQVDTNLTIAKIEQVRS